MSRVENFVTLLSWASLCISVPLVLINLWALYWLNHTKDGRKHAWAHLVKYGEYADEVLYTSLLIAAGVTVAASLWLLA